MPAVTELDFASRGAACPWPVPTSPTAVNKRMPYHSTLSSNALKHPSALSLRSRTAADSSKSQTYLSTTPVGHKHQLCVPQHLCMILLSFDSLQSGTTHVAKYPITASALSSAGGVTSSSFTGFTELLGYFTTPHMRACVSESVSTLWPILQSDANFLYEVSVPGYINATWASSSPC